MAISLPKRSFINKAKQKVVDVTSDALSFPARMKAKNAVKDAMGKVKILQEAKKVPASALMKDQRDAGFRLKTAAQNIKDEEMMKARKLRAQYPKK